MNNDYFICREPLGNVTSLLNIERNGSFNNSIYDLIKNDKQFLLAVSAASPNLANSLLANNYNSKITNSLQKYFLRYVTRATPFGFFSATSIGTNKLSLANKALYKNIIRVSGSWLNLLINEIQSNEIYLYNLKVTLNNSLYQNNNEIINYFSYNNEGGLKKKKILLKTRLLELVTDCCKNKFIKVSELYEKITSNSLDKHRFLKYIKELLDIGILHSELTPTMNSKMNLFEDFLNKVEKFYQPYSHINELYEIAQLINDFNNDCNSVCVIQIVNKMKNIVKSTRYLDCIVINNYIMENPNFHREKNTLEKFLNRTATISNYFFNSLHKDLIDYKGKYIEKFGYDREVPFYEMIDSIGGIGIPETLEIDIENKDEYQELESYIVNSYTLKKVIDLNDTFFQRLFRLGKNSNNCDTSITNELFVMDFESEMVSNTEKTIFLSPIIGVRQIGNTIGRFFLDYPAQIQDRIKDMNNKVIKRYEKEKIELVSLLPYFGNSSGEDLVPNYSFTKSSTVIGYNCSDKDINQFDLNDLLVGIDRENEFYFINRNSNNQIKFTTFSNLNSFIGSKAYDLLLRLSYEQSTFYIIECIVNILRKFNLSCRVIYKNILVVSKKMDIFYPIKDVQKLKKKIRETFNSKYFYIQNNDNRLLINMDIDDWFNIFLEELKHQKKICVSEVEPLFSDLLEKNAQDIQIKENVYSFFNSEKLTNVKRIGQYTSSTLEVRRELLPFEECTQFNIYISKEYQNSFILKKLSPYIKHLKTQGRITKWFFIRYIDSDGEHLRVRLFSKEQEAFQNFLFFLNKSIQEKIISKYEISVYNRELERYECINNYELVENYFCELSEISLKILQYKKELELQTVIYIVNLINKFQLNKQRIIQTMSVNKNIDNDKEFRNIKAILLESYLNNKYVFSYTRFEKYILQLNKDHVSELKKREILFSLIHMLCNRIYGPNKEAERKIIDYVRKFLDLSLHLGV
ncbi:hypothetical protein RV03_GL003165 [Enterococcus gallinarum]|nr:hypothetical protein RV03_GL003165 [Enterococcus gallinarum]